MAKTVTLNEDLQKLLDLGMPKDMTEEEWAIKAKVGIRTVRRAKKREVVLRLPVLRKMARNLQRLGGTLDQRIGRLWRATLPLHPARGR